MNIRLGFFALLLCFLFSLQTSAFELFEFNGWDHSLISTVGQTFNDVSGDLDVMVESVGAFDADSTYVLSATGSGMVAAIRSDHTGIGSHSLIFHFSRPIDAIVDFTRLDTQELLGVYGIGSEVYTHVEGNSPTEMIDGSGITLQGNGFGPSATNGYVQSGPTSVLTVSYRSLGAGTTKYQDFNVGQVVPEPGCGSLLALSLLGLLPAFRRRNG